MIFERQIKEELIQWKTRSQRKPLLLRGARQVGKSTLIKEFAENYRQFISLNLEKIEDRYFFEEIEKVSDIVNAIFISRNI